MRSSGRPRRRCAASVAVTPMTRVSSHEPDQQQPRVAVDPREEIAGRNDRREDPALEFERRQRDEIAAPVGAAVDPRLDRLVDVGHRETGLAR